MPQLEIEVIPALKDNYVYLLHEPESRQTAVVDPGEAAPVIAALDRTGRRLDLILNTHHHGDHTGGNAMLAERYGARLVAPAYDAHRIADIDEAVEHGNTVALGASQAEVIFVPGHTSGHIAFWFAGDRALFCGDTLFSLGCGRVIEGSMEQMWTSLLRLSTLPDEARVHCGHEYTLANGRFAMTVEAGNAALAARIKEAEAQRQAGDPTVPSLLGDEKRANPFLRAADPALAAELGLAGRPAWQVFAELRERKNRF